MGFQTAPEPVCRGDFRSLDPVIGVSVLPAASSLVGVSLLAGGSVLAAGVGLATGASLIGGRNCTLDPASESDSVNALTRAMYLLALLQARSNR